MAAVRRDILSDADARDQYIEGVKRLKREVLPGSTYTTYDIFVAWHYRTMMTPTPPGNPAGRNAAHRGSVFLPWHRYLMIVLEKHLQRVLGDDDFGLPYWNWATDGDKPADEQRDSPIFSDDCMGGGDETGPIASGPFKYDPADPQSWRVFYDTGPQAELRRIPGGRGLWRTFKPDIPVRLPSSAQCRAVVDMTPYDTDSWDDRSDSFRNWLEGWRGTPAPGMHNVVHVWVSGDMDPPSSPNDPVFFLNHCNVDRVWAAWQQKHHDPPYLPDMTAHSSLRGHRSGDRLSSPFQNPPKVSDMLDVSAVYTYDTVADLV